MGSAAQITSAALGSIDSAHASGKAIAGRYGDELAGKVRIQYGGSMNPGNVKGLMAQPEIDGGLIGGASLKAPDFAKVVAMGK